MRDHAATQLEVSRRRTVVAATLAVGSRYFRTSTLNLGIALQIVRLRADANLDTVTKALRSLRPEKNAHDRFAVIKATVGEGEERAFLISANKGDKDVGLLAAGPDKQIILSTKDVSGNDVRVTGKVHSFTKGPHLGIASVGELFGAVGVISGGYLGLLTAVSGTMALNPAPGPIFAGIIGALAVFGAGRAFAEVVRRSDGADWAAVAVHGVTEGKPVPVEVHGIEQAPTPVVALPAPTESPFVIPPVTLPVREKVGV